MLFKYLTGKWKAETVEHISCCGVLYSSSLNPNVTIKNGYCILRTIVKQYPSLTRL